LDSKNSSFNHSLAAQLEEQFAGRRSTVLQTQLFGPPESRGSGENRKTTKVVNCLYFILWARKGAYGDQSGSFDLDVM
jgi:hypothetical protein